MLTAFGFAAMCYIVQTLEQGNSELAMMIGIITAGMRLRQIVCVLLLFILGFIFLFIINESINTVWLFLLSYPLGVLIWVGMSMVLLLAGIPYSLFTMTVAIILFVALFVIRRRGENYHYDKEILMHGAIIGIGVLSIASTGIQFTFSSYDTRYFVELLGKSLVIEGRISRDFKTYFVNSGMGPATLSSLAYMFNVDSIYIVHHTLIINFFIMFYYSLYMKFREHWGGKRSTIFSLVSTLFLVLLPEIQLVGGWVISNAYIMVYLFVIIVLLDQIKDKNKMPNDYKKILAVIFFVFTFLRIDSGITACCIFGAVAISRLCNRHVLCYCILPSLSSFILLLLKMYLITKGNIDGYLGSWGTLGAILLLYLGVVVYYFARGHILQIVQNKFENYILAITFLIFAVLFLYRPELCMDSIKTLMYNFMELSQDGDFWGVTFPLFLLFWWMSHQVYRGKMQMLELAALLVILVTVDLVILRGCIGLSVRRGLGDSFNRQFISYVPLTLYAILDRMSQNIRA